MLVLSRRLNEKIVFPSLGVTVEVVNVARNVVRLGIDAPPSVQILRQELTANEVSAPAGEKKPARHRVRNRLHTAALALHLAEKQMQAGLTQQAGASMQDALREFAAIEGELTPVAPPKPVRPVSALVVEDNRNESELLAEFLRLNGFHVATANDGQDALDYLKSHDRPDVVLLDMRMPRCDGPATIAAIRREPAYQDLKVFAVSGADPSECALTSGDRGVDGWFTKPVNPAKLVLQMNRALGLN